MADPVNIALSPVRFRFFKSVLDEIRENATAAATYAQRLQECQARIASARAEADAELVSLGVDPATRDAELNETARVLVVTDKAPREE
jgi:hypothetical protein